MFVLRRKLPEWVDAQNKVAREYLDGIPSREMFEERLTKLWNYERFSAPWKVGDKYFYQRNDGLQNQSVLYVADTFDGEGRVSD